MTTSKTSPDPVVNLPLSSRWSQFYALTKPRVVQLIVFCALIGMVLAVPGLPNLAELQLAALACAGIWLVAGAAAAFNCIVEQHIDARMRRTAWRPTAKGQLSNTETLAFSAALCALGSFILYVWVNPLTMWLTFATFVDILLERTIIIMIMTMQNWGRPWSIKNDYCNLIEHQHLGHKFLTIRKIISLRLLVCGLRSKSKESIM